MHSFSKLVDFFPKCWAKRFRKFKIFQVNHISSHWLAEKQPHYNDTGVVPTLTKNREIDKIEADAIRQKKLDEKNAMKEILYVK